MFCQMLMGNYTKIGLPSYDRTCNERSNQQFHSWQQTFFLWGLRDVTNFMVRLHTYLKTYWSLVSLVVVSPSRGYMTVYSASLIIGRYRQKNII